MVSSSLQSSRSAECMRLQWRSYKGGVTPLCNLLKFPSLLIINIPGRPPILTSKHPSPASPHIYSTLASTNRTTMLFFLPFLLLAPLFALASPVPLAPALSQQYYPWTPVTWTVAPKNIKAGSTYGLKWKGGSGHGYASLPRSLTKSAADKQQIYYIPQWEGQGNYKAVDIASTSMTSVKWKTPALDAYPEGTTLYVTFPVLPFLPRWACCETQSISLYMPPALSA